VKDSLTIIVPARSGSKRLPGKNLLSLNGRPLVFHTLDAALGHPEVDKVIFTTDSEHYIDVAVAEYGSEIHCIRRPSNTATDAAKVTEEVSRLLDEEASLFSGPWFGLFLPTAPLRDRKIVRDVLDEWKKHKRPVFSCHRFDFPAQFAFLRGSGDNEWSPLLGDESPMVTGQTRSQDIAPTYRPNGAIYVTRVEIFNRRKVLYDEAVPVEIPAVNSIDVDDELSFRFAEFILREGLG